jgi:hypothetical protein
VLASYKITREDWQKQRDARNAAYEQQLQSLTGGSYRVTFTMPEMVHMSFSDQQLLEAASEAQFRQAAQNLSMIEDYTLAFFDKYLKRRSGTILDSIQKTPAGVEMKKYAR